MEHIDNRITDARANLALEEYILRNVEGDDSFLFPIGELDIRIQVEGGWIRDRRIFGDFMSRGDIGELEARMRDVRYTREDLSRAIAGIDVGEYFEDIGNDDVLALLVD